MTFMADYCDAWFDGEEGCGAGWVDRDAFQQVGASVVAFVAAIEVPEALGALRSEDGVVDWTVVRTAARTDHPALGGAPVGAQFTQPLMWVVSSPPEMVIEPERTRTAQPASPPSPGCARCCRRLRRRRRRPSRRPRRPAS